MSNKQQLSKAAKCLEMIRSPNDGEALSAARSLVRVLDGQGLQHVLEDNTKLKEALRDCMAALVRVNSEVMELRAWQLKVLRKPFVLRKLAGIR